MAVGRPPPSTLPCSLRPPASGRDTRTRRAKRVASSAAREWVMAVARVAELVAVKVADAVVAAAVVLMVVLVVDLAAATVEAATEAATATISRLFRKLGRRFDSPSSNASGRVYVPRCVSLFYHVFDAYIAPSFLRICVSSGALTRFGRAGPCTKHSHCVYYLHIQTHARNVHELSHEDLLEQMTIVDRRPPSVLRVVFVILGSCDRREEQQFVARSNLE